ncbi:MAG: hypothetical protein ABJ370_14655 [Paracoccaceae bacterium]
MCKQTLLRSASLAVSVSVSVSVFSIVFSVFYFVVVFSVFYIVVGGVYAARVGLAVVSVFANPFKLRTFLDFSKTKRTGEVFSAPGAMAVLILQFLVPKKAYEEVFVQVVADTRDVYFTALAEGNNVKAKWIRIRDSVILAFVFVEYLIASCLDRGMKIYKILGSR